MRSPRARAFSKVFAVLILSALLPTAMRAFQRFSNAPDASTSPDVEWDSYGLDYAETRYSPLSQINSTNVSRLGLAWTYDVPPGRGEASAYGEETTPLMVNGTLYSITGWSVTYAVDAQTGKEKWRYDPKVDRHHFRKLKALGMNRGVGFYAGKIFVPVFDGRLVALNADTGDVVWSVQTTPLNQNYTITMAPRVVKGKVVIGNSGAEFPVRGYVSAYDCDTGNLVWRFYTVPGNPADGFENEAMRRAADTWSGQWYTMGGGGTVWDSLSYDVDLNAVYFGTGNGGPWPEELRQSKGKDNLFIASVVAVDADTGHYKWHYQFTPGDSWDYDANQQLTLVNMRIDGRERRVMLQANKNGFFYILDRTDGRLISAAPFAEVNWASGIDLKTGRPIINPEARYGFDPICISPGPDGGAHGWWPMSFNPATGLVYIPIRTGSSYTFSVEQDFVYNPETYNRGVRNEGACMTPPMVGPVRKTETGSAVDRWLIAWDPMTQQERWSVPGSNDGTLTTAGNLVFQPSAGLTAYSADKGELLWKSPRFPGTAAAPITYRIGGKQYIVVTIDGNAAGFSSVPPRVLAFALDGDTAMPSAPVPPPKPASSPSDPGHQLVVDFVKIPPGEFSMGCSGTACTAQEKPAHTVRITKAFEIARYETTQQQWEAVMGSNPSAFKGNLLPVERVSWNDIQTFLNRLNARNDGYRYRLPTEAEWEYAARAGSDSPGAMNLQSVAWYEDTAEGKTHPIGSKDPNAWGLHDTLGNVFEFVHDVYAEYADAAAEDPVVLKSNTPGPALSVYRGGSWFQPAASSTATYRGRQPRGDTYSDQVGFRLVRELIR